VGSNAGIALHAWGSPGLLSFRSRQIGTSFSWVEGSAPLIQPHEFDIRCGSSDVRNVTLRNVNFKVLVWKLILQCVDVQINGLTGQTLTFSQTRDAIRRLASGFARHGVQQNDVVMIVSENSVEYVLTFHAVLSLGATLTMANPIYLTSKSIEISWDTFTSISNIVMSSYRHESVFSAVIRFEL